MDEFSHLPRTSLLWLLGTMADPDETDGAAAPEVQAAVATQAPVLLPAQAHLDLLEAFIRR